MPSPFPGMNPYLENEYVWNDFHSTFIVHAANALSRQVTEDYFVRIGVRRYVHELPADQRIFRGVVLPAFDVQRESHIEIVACDDRHVVTTIELVSRANKIDGVDRDQYLATRKTTLSSLMHLVEIDLLRGGIRLPLPQLPPCHYSVLVSRSHDRPRTCFWPIGLRERLPVVPIPLTAPNPDLTLDLKGVLDRSYDGAGYKKYIYTEIPDPPLTPEDAAWARQYLPSDD